MDHEKKNDRYLEPKQQKTNACAREILASEPQILIGAKKLNKI